MPVAGKLRVAEVLPVQVAGVPQVAEVSVVAEVGRQLADGAQAVETAQVAVLAVVVPAVAVLAAESTPARGADESPCAGVRRPLRQAKQQQRQIRLHSLRFAEIQAQLPTYQMTEYPTRTKKLWRV